MKARTVFIDGILYFVTAASVPALEYLSGEEAYKYIAPAVLFWLKFTIGSTVAGANGLKGFRSMSFGWFVQQQQEKEDQDNENNQKTPPVQPTPAVPPIAPPVQGGPR